MCKEKKCEWVNVTMTITCQRVVHYFVCVSGLFIHEKNVDKITFMVSWMKIDTKNHVFVPNSYVTLSYISFNVSMLIYTQYTFPYVTLHSSLYATFLSIRFWARCESGTWEISFCYVSKSGRERCECVKMETHLPRELHSWLIHIHCIRKLRLCHY